VQVGLGGSDRHAGDFSDFSVPISLDIVQNEDRARAGGQGCDRSLEIEREVAGLPLGAEPFGVNIVEWKLAPTSSSVHAVIRHDDIHRQPVKPRRQRASPAKQVKLSPGPNEGLLGELLGEVRVSGEAPTQRVDPPNLLSVDLLESPSIAILGALHEPFRLLLRGRTGFHRTRNHGKGIRHSTLDASGRVLV
jgi:hypothetical protein